MHAARRDGDATSPPCNPRCPLAPRAAPAVAARRDRVAAAAPRPAASAQPRPPRHASPSVTDCVFLRRAGCLQRSSRRSDIFSRRGWAQDIQDTLARVNLAVAAIRTAKNGIPRGTDTSRFRSRGPFIARNRAHDYIYSHPIRPYALRLFPYFVGISYRVLLAILSLY